MMLGDIMTIDVFLKKQRIYQKIRKIALCIILLSIIGLFFKIFYLFILIIVCLLVMSYLQEQFTKQAYLFKKNHLKDEIKSRMPTIRYEMDQGIPASDVFGSKLLKKEDIYHSEDLLYGE